VIGIFNSLEILFAAEAAFKEHDSFSWQVHAHVDVYNMSSNMWESKIPMPAAMAHSHLGMATDGRFIYILSGQFGSQCRRPTARNFVLDTLTKTWSLLLPLPHPR